MHDVDSPDFNKARGFLIGYSLVVVLLWFFGADLTKFKLMGNEVDLYKHTQHVWGVIALINVYLWFRFFQRLPKRALRFDERMHDLLDGCLVSACRLLHKRKAFRREAKMLADEDGSKLDRLVMDGHLPYRVEMEQKEGAGTYDPLHPWNYSYPKRAQVDFSLTKYSIHEGRTVTGIGGNGYQARPSRAEYRVIVTCAFLKGAVCHSWFSDNIGPLLFGAISSLVAAVHWWQVNHPG